MIKNAQKPSDIWEQMGDKGINVGPRYGKNKRSNQDEELWCLRRLLDVLVEHNKIDWPLSVQQSDAPDFLVTENKLSYGLEVTQAISSQDARELTEAEHSQSGVYFIGDFGGRKPASKLETAAEFTFNIQSAINKKSKKTYVISNQTDLLIYVHGNNGIWLDGNPVDEEGNKYRELVSNYPYQSIDCFRRVILHWNSGRTYFLKDI